VVFLERALITDGVLVGRFDLAALAQPHLISFFVFLAHILTRLVRTTQLNVDSDVGM
jgi:hypothetical protein